jgi:ribosomal protein S18 acetylase RimI-like enzyme
MADVYKAPEPWRRGKYILFLAGVIDQGKAENWNSRVINALEPYDITILSPRRDDWDPDMEQSVDNPAFREQLVWERTGLEEADYRTFVWLKDSKGPITLQEEGKFGDKPGVVCCEEGYERQGNVDFDALLEGLPIVRSIDELIEHLKQMLDSRGIKKQSHLLAPKLPLTVYRAQALDADKTAASKTARVIGPVYHGTTYEFDEFKRNKGLRSGFLGSVMETDVFAYFFTESRQQAVAYAKNRQLHTKQPGRLITSYLTINNLLNLTDPNWVNLPITHPPLPLHKLEEGVDPDDIYEDHADDLDSANGLLDYLVNFLLADEMTSVEWGDLGIDDGHINGRIVREPSLEEGFNAYFLFDNKKVSDALRYLGFDGAKVPEGDDPEFGGESYCVFSSNQVRIASNTAIDKNKAAAEAPTPIAETPVKSATVKIASPEDLEILKSTLTLTPAQQGEELARMYDYVFRDFLEHRHPDLMKYLPPSEHEGLDDYSVFPENVMAEFRGDYLEYDSSIASDPEAPTFLTVDFLRDVNEEWLVSFTDAAKAIAAQGFKYGISDPGMLALTTQFTDNAKKNGGYNFAYAANDPRHYRKGEKYGSQFVVFKASGILAYHHGDEEPQVIFWGKDAHDFVPVMQDDSGLWTIYDGEGEPLFESDDIKGAVDWVINNYSAYRNGQTKSVAASVKQVTAKHAELVSAKMANVTGCDWRNTSTKSIRLADLDAEFEDFNVLVMQYVEDRGNGEVDWEKQVPVYYMPIAKAMKEFAAWGMPGADGDDEGDERGEPHIAELMKSMESGTRLPPALTDSDGALLDGRHRTHAASRLGVKQIPYIKLDDVIARSAKTSAIAAPDAEVSETESDSSEDKKPAQPAQSAAFHAWFSGSKVVDKDGNPLRCYHGTRSSVDFDEFSTSGPVNDGEEISSSGSGADPTAFLGAHFAQETSVANQFAQGSGWMKSRYDGDSPKPRVIPVYLAIKNPKDFGSEHNLRSFIYEGTLDGYAADELMNSAMEADGLDPEDDENPEVEAWNEKYNSDPAFRAEQHNWLFESHSPSEGEDSLLEEAASDLGFEARRRLEAAGHDGIRYKNVVEGGISWIAFDSNQIKSAIGNAGTFDPKSTSITASYLLTRKAVGINRADPFYPALKALTPQMAEAAQKIYDSWEQGEEDDDLGGGGICDEIAGAIAGIIVGNITDSDTVDGGQDGDDHAWVIAGLNGKAYGVDIPPGVYETGGGYSWTKRPLVTFDASDVDIFPIPYKDAFGDGVSITAADKTFAPLTFRTEGDGLEFDIKVTEPDPHSPSWAPDSRLLVGYIDIKPVDFLPDAEAQGAAYVFDVNVEDEWRGTGLGQKLYDMAIAEAKERGATKFMSSTDQTKYAHAAWRRLGQRYKVKRFGKAYYIDLQPTAVTASAARVTAKRADLVKAKLAATQPVTPGGGGFQPWYNTDLGDRPKYEPVHRPATESDEFLKWFGDSKVRDEEGDPLTCFHATSSESKQFTSRGGNGYGQFGHFFDAHPHTPEFPYAGGKKREDQPNTIAVFLSIQNPKVFPDSETFRDAVNGKFGPNIPARSQKLRTDLKKAGYDGALINNASNGGVDYWVAFDQKQIKSATGNSGGFSTTDKSIMASSTGDGLVDWRKPVEGLKTSLRELEKGAPDVAKNIISLFYLIGVKPEDVMDKQVPINWENADSHWEELNHDGPEVNRKVNELSQAMKQGIKLAPALLYRGHWMDGNHRINAAEEIGVRMVPTINLWSFTQPRDTDISDDELLAQLGLAKEADTKSLDITETPKFKAWFAGSKILDSHGKPLLVFHGSSEDLDGFDYGRTIHFVDSKATANSYARGYLNSQPGNIYAAYLKITNPIDLRKPGETERVHAETDQYIDSDLVLDPEELFKFDIDETPYDGVINPHETGGGARDGNAEYVVFNPEQVWVVTTEAVGSRAKEGGLKCASCESGDCLAHSKEAGFNLLQKALATALTVGTLAGAAMYKAPTDQTDKELTTVGHEMAMRLPQPILKKIGDPNTITFKEGVPPGGSPQAICQVAPGTRVVYVNPKYVNDFLNTDAGDQLTAHELTHVMQSQIDPKDNRFPKVDEANPYGKMKDSNAAEVLQGLRAKGDRMWDHSREEQGMIVQQYEALTDMLRKTQDPDQKKGIEQKIQIFNQYINDYDQMKTSAAKNCGSCGCPWSEHHHLADFGCKNEPGCGCTGWADKKTASASDENYFMEEGCGAFAAALASIYPGTKCYILSRKDGERWSKAIPYECTHAYALLPGDKFFDVKGERSLDAMAADFDMTGHYQVRGPFSPEEFKNRFLGNSDRKPLYGDRQIIAEAKEFIEAHTNRFPQQKTAKVAASREQMIGKAKLLRRTSASDEAERAAAEQYQDEHEFLKHHNTGYIPQSAYSDKMFDVEHSPWLKVEHYPKLLKQVTLKDGTKVDLRQEGKKLQYVKQGEPDKDGHREIMRDEHDMALDMSDEEIEAEGLPMYDTAIHAFNDKGECVGIASDEWGADGIWVRSDYQRKGLGTNLLTEFRRQFKNVRQIGQMTDAGRAMTKSYYRSLTGKEPIPERDIEEDDGYIARRTIWRFFANLEWADWGKFTPEQANKLKEFETRVEKPRSTEDPQELLKELRTWVGAQGTGFATPSAEKVLAGKTASAPFDLHKIAGFDTDATDWKWMVRNIWDRAKEAHSPAEAKRYYAAMKQAVRDGSIDPIKVAKGEDGKYRVMDGKHRVALAHVLGVDKIPAKLTTQTVNEASL